MTTGAIGIVGSGRMARALGRAIHRRGQPITHVASQVLERAADAAAFIGEGVAAVAPADLAGRVERLIIATSDDRIAPVARLLADAGVRDVIALHTCGARGPAALAALREADSECGVLHPLQTIADPERARFDGVTFGVAGDPGAVAWASELAHLVGGRSLTLPPEHLTAYHAGAALAANAMAAVIDAAVALMASAGVSSDTARDALGPLVRASLENALGLGPEAALTGPVSRGDVTTIEAHLGALRSAPPEIAALYVAVSRHLLNIAGRRGLPVGSRRAIAAALDASRRRI
jgi:predicted short-subunit dehydrogenase-like oxidoreductase (DUF2520 family)